MSTGGLSKARLSRIHDVMAGALPFEISYYGGHRILGGYGPTHMNGVAGGFARELSRDFRIIYYAHNKRKEKNNERKTWRC